MEFLIASGTGYDKSLLENIKSAFHDSSRRACNTLLESSILGGSGVLLRSYFDGEFVENSLQAFDGCAVNEGEVYTSAAPPKFSYRCSDSFFDNARGMFCRVVGSDAEDKIFIERDILGVYPVWHASYRNISFASNNIYCIADIIKRLGGKANRNSFYSASEIALENALWGESAFEGVYLLGVHEKISFNSQGASIISFQPWYYQSNFSYESLLEKACEDIRENLRAVANSRYSHKVSDLTGGYDSRMILSGIVGQGLQDSFSFFTSGVNTGDSSAASFLRNKYRLKKTLYDTTGSLGDMVDRVRRSLSASYGQHSMADYANYMPDVIECNGTMGELFRQFYSLPSEISPIDSIKSYYSSRLSILPVGAFERVMQGYEEFFENKRKQGFSVDESFYHLYLEQRNQQFVGISMRAKSNVQSIALPLYSPAGAAAALALSSKERKDLRLVYDITKKLHHDLVFPPLENRVWPCFDKEDEPLLSKVTPFVNGCKDYEDVMAPYLINKVYPEFGGVKEKHLSLWEINARKKGWRWNWKHLDKALSHGRACLEGISYSQDSECIDLNYLVDLFSRSPHDFKRNYEVRQVWRSLFSIIWISGKEEFVRH